MNLKNLNNKKIIYLISILVFINIILLGTGVYKPSKIIVEYQNLEFGVNRKNPGYNAEQQEIINTIISNLEAPKNFQNFDGYVDFYTPYFVPGLGSATGGYGDATEKGLFSYISIELANIQKHRILVYTSPAPDSIYQIVDDFYYEGPFPPSIEFKVENNTLYYINDLNQGEVIKTLAL